MSCCPEDIEEFAGDFNGRPFHGIGWEHNLESWIWHSSYSKPGIGDCETEIC
jgi:hypothetical protein